MTRALLWLALSLALAILAGILAADRHPWMAGGAITLAYLAIPRTLAALPERKEGDR